LSGTAGDTGSTLVCIGLGYCARHYVADFGSGFARVIGTTRSQENADRPASAHRIEMLVFDGAVTASIAAAIANTDALLVSTPPAEGGDPVLAALTGALVDAPKLSSIVYLSSVGVYGDHAGAWVDETTAPKPSSARSRARLAAETAWQQLGERARKPVAILRLAGIYGPGRNALAQVRAGTAKRVVKDGQVFGRIHVADIAAIIEQAFARQADGIFNVTDNEPTPPQDVIGFAAELLGVAVPPEVPFVEARTAMSPAALSFYAECRRVRNERIKHELGITLRYPSYREGLRALLELERR